MRVRTAIVPFFGRAPDPFGLIPVRQLSLVAEVAEYGDHGFAIVPHDHSRVVIHFLSYRKNRAPRMSLSKSSRTKRVSFHSAVDK